MTTEPNDGGFIIIGETVTVQPMDTGLLVREVPHVNRPDVVAKAVGYMTEAVEHAGGTVDNSHLRFVYDEEPSIEQEQ
jgi:hypothetical protein